MRQAGTGPNGPLMAPKGATLSGAIDVVSPTSAVSPYSATLAGTTIPYEKGREGIMYIREQRQQNQVADEVLALTAVVRPIRSFGMLYPTMRSQERSTQTFGAWDSFRGRRHPA